MSILKDSYKIKWNGSRTYTDNDDNNFLAIKSHWIFLAFYHVSHDDDDDDDDVSSLFASNRLMLQTHWNIHQNCLPFNDDHDDDDWIEMKRKIFVGFFIIQFIYYTW